MPRYVLSIDQGTTGTTIMILDETIRVVAKVTREFEQIYPRPGWVEHDPAAIWASVTGAIAETLQVSGVDPEAIASIGITNQRETSLIWDRASGKPVHNAIVWQDRRTADLCQTLKDEELEPLFRQRTGLVLDPYFSGTKVRWMLDNIAGARESATAGKLAFGTVDSYLIWRLTGGAHVTEVSNASRTLLFNLETLGWDEELLDLLQVPGELMPRVCSSSEVYGETRGVPGLPDGIPVAGAAGDQQAALFGQACFAPGDAKCTYGTGAFLLVNTGERPVASKSGVLTTVGWRIGSSPAVYALEGSAFIAGAAVQWLRDGLKLFGSAPEVEELARRVPDSGGVVFVPALVGLGAPHWRPNARGVITGITRGTTAAHLARATLDGIALQIHDLAHAVSNDTGQPLTSFKVDGGACANNLLMQFQADILEMTIVRPEVIETTALGAAFLAGLAVGVWHDPEAIRQAWKPDRTFEPRMSAKERETYLTDWAEAIAIT